jgi:hypothetical protein
MACHQPLHEAVVNVNCHAHGSISMR